jgi:hypothetical protein
MARRGIAVLALLTIVLVSARAASAGMASVAPADLRRVCSLSTLTRARIESISFFVVCLLLSAKIIQRIWNALQKDFTILPRLSYGKALGLIVLWGLLFVLILTMISGARELLTPGAWKKEGWTFRLTEDAARDAERQITQRHEALERLATALVDYARTHQRQFPSGDAVSAIPDADWIAPGPSGQRYGYSGGRLYIDDSDGVEPFAPLAILAYEPESFGADRLVALTDGSIRWMPETVIAQSLRVRRLP